MFQPVLSRHSLGGVSAAEQGRKVPPYTDMLHQRGKIWTAVLRAGGLWRYRDVGMLGYAEEGCGDAGKKGCRGTSILGMWGRRAVGMRRCGEIWMWGCGDAERWEVEKPHSSTDTSALHAWEWLQFLLQDQPPQRPSQGIFPMSQSRHH